MATRLFYRLGLFGCCGLLLCGAAKARAQDWTRFRGPNGGGESEANIPASWSDRDYNWKVTLPGAGHSSPVLWGDKIFLTAAEPGTANLLVFSLAAADGKLLWKKEYPGSTYHIHTQNSFATGTPAVDADRVYVAWATPQQYTLVALSHEGKEIWRRNLGPFTSQHGFGSSPIVVGDLVIIGDEQDGKNPNDISSKSSRSGPPVAEGDNDGHSALLAFDRHTGLPRWKTPRLSSIVSYSTPCVRLPDHGDPELICDSRSHGVSAIDPNTGHVNWELPIFDRRTVGSPLVVGDLVLAACGVGSGNNTLFAIRPGDRSGHKPEVVYKIDKAFAPYVTTPVAKGNLVFIWSDRGVITCIDAISGAIKWHEHIGGNFSGSPVRAGDRIFCVSADGEVIVVAAADKYELLGRNPLNELSRSTPAIAGGRMYVRTETHLYSVGGKPGS